MTTRRLYFLKTILSNKVSFVALFVSACYFATLYVGLGSSSKSFNNSVNAYFDHQRLHVFAVYSSLGFSDEDIDAMRAIDTGLTGGYTEILLRSDREEVRQQYPVNRQEGVENRGC